MVSNRTKLLIGLIGVAVIWAVGGLIGNQYYLNLITLGFMYAYLATCWNLVGGYLGQFSLGHGIFVGLGAYVPTILFMEFGLTPWIGMFAGAAASAVVAWAMAAGTFRFGLRGFYFALATLAVGEAFRKGFLGLEVGGDGAKIQIPLTQNPLHMQFGSNLWYALVIGLFLCGVLVITYLLERRPLGYFTKAIRDNEDAARALGIRATRIKTGLFIFSAALTAFGGTFHAQYSLYLHPDIQFSMIFTVQMLLATFLGGKGTVLGPALGAALLLLISTGFSSIPIISGEGAAITRILYGILIMVVALVTPGGIMGLVNRYSERSVKHTKVSNQPL